MYFYSARITGIELSYSFRFADCAKYLNRILTGPAAEHSTDFVQVKDSEFLAWEKHGGEADAFAEYCLSCVPTSEALFSYDRCIFHAAAIRFRDHAWLISAGSGVGKSTQCAALMKLAPDEFTVINGDKPVLELCDDGTVMVHPSPWNGKEGLEGADSAPLAGLILLRRGEENSVVPAASKFTAVGIYRAIFQSYDDDEIIRKAAAIAERIMKSAPAWLMTSNTVPESTKRLLDVIKEEAAEHDL